jgi:predicted kinase
MERAREPAPPGRGPVKDLPRAVLGYRGSGKETIAQAEALIEDLRTNRIKIDEEQRRLTRWEDSLIGIEDGASDLVQQVLTDMR